MHDSCVQSPAVSGNADLVNRLASELAQVQRALAHGQHKLASTTRTLQARALELSEARAAVEMLLGTLHAEVDGILTVGTHGRAMHCNRSFESMWGITAERLRSLNEPALLALQLSQVRDPASFLAQVERERARPDEEHRSSVELTDGRVLERHVVPHGARGRRLGCVTRYREKNPS